MKEAHNNKIVSAQTTSLFSAFDSKHQEQNIYQKEYVDDLMEDDAISLEEAGFLEGYNS